MKTIMMRFSLFQSETIQTNCLVGAVLIFIYVCCDVSADSTSSQSIDGLAKLDAVNGTVNLSKNFHLNDTYSNNSKTLTARLNDTAKTFRMPIEFDEIFERAETIATKSPPMNVTKVRANAENDTSSTITINPMGEKNLFSTTTTVSPIELALTTTTSPVSSKRKKSTVGPRILSTSSEPLSRASKNNSDYTGAGTSFRDRYKFRLHKNLEASQRNNSHYTIDYSLPSWFNYDFYKKYYDKKYSHDDESNVREKIFLQTAMKVLDFRARFTANKFKQLVFINELSDLTNEEIQNITYSGDQNLVKFDNLMTKGNNLTCCSYEQAIEKLKRYYRMSDNNLQQAIIDEISEQGDPHNNVADGQVKPPPYTFSIYHSKNSHFGQANMQQSTYNRNHPLTKSKTALHKQEIPVKGLNGDDNLNHNRTDKLNPFSSKLQLNETQDNQLKEATTFTNTNKHDYRLMDFGGENRRDEPFRLDSRPSQTLSPTIANDVHISTNDSATKENTAKNGHKDQVKQPSTTNNHANTEQAMQLSLAKDINANVSNKNSEIDEEEERDIAEREMQELGLQQAIQDQIVEQFKLQVGEQLRQKFSQQFGRPVIVRPRQFYTISTTPYPTNDMDPNDKRVQQQQNASDISTSNGASSVDVISDSYKVGATTPNSTSAPIDVDLS